MEDFDFVIPLIDEKLTAAVKRKLLDVAYCETSPSQKMDIYFPNGQSEKLYPVIVYFHGGAFMKGTRKDDALEPMLRATERGYVVVSVDYRLSVEARFPAMVYDGKTAIRFIRAHAEEYGIDPDKIAVWGPSSGGWLASFIAVTAGNPAFEDKSMGYGEYSSEVNAVIDWCGPTADFAKMDEELKASGAGLPDHNEEISPESRFLGTQITKVPELCRLSAVTTYVNRHIPPFCIFHGEIDQVVPVQQSIELAEIIRKVAGDDRVELHVEKGKLHHGHPWYHEKWVSDTCIDFLDKVFSEEYMKEHGRHGMDGHGRHGMHGHHAHPHGHREGEERITDENTCDGCGRGCSLSNPHCEVGLQKAKVQEKR